MRPYRCYFIDDADRIANVAVGACQDDGHARDWGLDQLSACPQYPAVEVWDLDRQVCRHLRAPL